MANKKRKAIINQEACAACGVCVGSCPRHAVSIEKGSYARIMADRCAGCGKCSAVCPASIVRIEEVAA